MLEIMVLIVFGALCLFGVSVAIMLFTMSKFVMDRIMKKTVEMTKEIIENDDWL